MGEWKNESRAVIWRGKMLLQSLDYYRKPHGHISVVSFSFERCFCQSPFYTVRYLVDSHVAKTHWEKTKRSYRRLNVRLSSPCTTSNRFPLNLCLCCLLAKDSLVWRKEWETQHEPHRISCSSRVVGYASIEIFLLDRSKTEKKIGRK